MFVRVVFSQFNDIELDAHGENQSRGGPRSALDAGHPPGLAPERSLWVRVPTTSCLKISRRTPAKGKGCKVVPVVSRRAPSRFLSLYYFALYSGT